jgi:bifunctional enzyme CysN/CysC
MTETARRFPIVIVGHVDHGKSTLIGRLLHDTGALPDGKFEELKAISKRRGVPIEWSFALDALQIERDQAITVDSTQIWFASPKRGYVIIDAPGHREFLRNMITGAAQADAAVIVVDVAQGASEQTRRHAYLLHLLGIPKVIVAVNKMDTVDFAQSPFERVQGEMLAYLEGLGLRVGDIIPVAARHGDNLAAPSANLSWWTGPTLVQALDALPARPVSANRPLRLPVQDVYRRDGRRILVGRIESGRLKVGDRVAFWPTGRSARVRQFVSWNTAPVLSAAAGQSVAFVLDDDLFVERGHVAGHETAGPRIAAAVHVKLFWLAATPLRAGQRLTLKVGTASHAVTVERIGAIVDVSDLSHGTAEAVEQNGIAEVVLRASAPMAVDLFADNPALGRVVLIDGYDVVGGGIVQADAVAAVDRAVTAVPQSVAAEERARVQGYRGAVLWMTGLSGSGKSTLAMALQRELFRRGLSAFVLDGDNIRSGLNRDLGFSPEDRTENLRRVAEVARLFADAGVIAISAFISPTEDSRRMARDIVGAAFHEVHVDADLAVCEARDVKGLYAKARDGALADFTGISAPWEPPAHADLALDTGRESLDASLQRLLGYVLGAVRIEGAREAAPARAPQ